MKYWTSFILFMALAACQAQDTKVVDDGADPKVEPGPSITQKVPPTGRIVITTEPLISEDAACIIPIQIRNGTDSEVSVSMFGFSVTGPGDDDTGNMFPQDVPPEQYRTARIIQLGQSCDAFDQIATKDVLCKTNGQNCAVEFESTDEMTFSQ